MEFLLFGLLSFVPLVLIAAVVVAIVVGLRRIGGETNEPGIGTIRRIFFYGLAFVGLMLAASGVAKILNELLAALSMSDVFQSSSFGMAFGLAATIVGLPAWLLFWRTAQRSIERYPGERGTLGRKLYVYLVLGISAAVTAFSAQRLISDALGASSVDVTTLAPIVVWGAVWAIHWRWEVTEGQPTEIARSMRRLYVYVTSSQGLVLLAMGLGVATATLLSTGYSSVFGGTLLRPEDGLWNETLQDALASTAVGGLWWWFHWHRHGRGDEASLLRQVVIYFLGVFGGIVTAVSSGAVIVHRVLEWVIDRPDTVSAASNFSVIPVALAATLVALGVWGYHSSLGVEEARGSGDRLPTARRAYNYLTAGVGLATLTTGMVLLAGTVIGVLVPSANRLAGAGFYGGPLTASLTALLVGGPLWAWFWLKQSSLVTSALDASSGIEERQAGSRRTFIFAVFGIAMLTTIAGMSTVLFQLLQAVLDGELSMRILDTGKWAIGAVLAAGAVSLYYWQVLKEDRASAPPEDENADADEPVSHAPAPATVAKRVSAVAVPAAQALLDALGVRLGVTVAVQTRRDDAGAPEPSGDEIDTLVEQIRSAPGDAVLLVVDAAGVQVIAV